MLTTETPSPPAATRGLGLHGLMTVLSLAMIAPFAWMMLASLKTLAEAGDQKRANEAFAKIIQALKSELKVEVRES